MRHTWKKMIAAALAAMCLVSGAMADGVLTEFYDAGCRLLFDTENVTLTGKAVFSLDGVRFKTAEGIYIQAGEDSYLKLGLNTPLSDGTERDTGYTVIANDNHIFVMEDYTPGVYREGETYTGSSLISRTVYLNSLMAMGRMVADTAEKSLEGHITATQAEDGGTGLEIRMGSGESPALLDGMVTLIGQYLAGAYFGVDYNYYTAAEETAATDYTLDDWTGLFAHLYEKDYGEAMPEDYYEVLWGEDEGEKETRALYENRYEAVGEEINELINDALARYESGWVEILADGTEQYYESQDAYVIAKGLQYTLYENYLETLRQRWEKEYGDAPDEEELTTGLWGEDEEMFARYQAIGEEMEEEYRQMAVADGKASGIWIRTDGTTEMIYDLQKWYERDRIYNFTTVSEGIVYCMRALAVDSAEIRAELDPQGRISGIRGTLKLRVTDDRKQDYALDVEFEFAAGAYGESKVEVFDPEKYGVSLK